MVKLELYISLLALTLSTSSALAENLHFRVGTIQLSKRDILDARDIYNNLEARDLSKASTGNYHRRGLEDDEELLQRDIYDDFEARDLFEELGSSGNYDRRGLEDDEEMLQRDFDDEELWAREYDSDELLGREYDDFLVERDDFDDLD